MTNVNATLSAGIGYVLLPDYVPEVAQGSAALVQGGRAQIAYGQPRAKLTISYPVDFTREESPEVQEIGLIRPDDAFAETTVNDQTAHLMYGGWSDETLFQGPSLDPSQARWDYDKSLTLFFDYQLSSGETVGVALQAIFDPEAPDPKWITEDELVTIAESMQENS